MNGPEKRWLQDIKRILRTTLYWLNFYIVSLYIER